MPIVLGVALGMVVIAPFLGRWRVEGGGIEYGLRKMHWRNGRLPVCLGLSCMSLTSRGFCAPRIAFLLDEVPSEDVGATEEFMCTPRSWRAG
jgi:hypothetical protein